MTYILKRKVSYSNSITNIIRRSLPNLIFQVCGLHLNILCSLILYIILKKNIKKKLKGSLNPQFIKKEKKFLYFKVGVLLYKHKRNHDVQKNRTKIRFFISTSTINYNEDNKLKQDLLKEYNGDILSPLFFFDLYFCTFS